jgi:Domain of unknown function (DUF4124)
MAFDPRSQKRIIPKSNKTPDAPMKAKLFFALGMLLTATVATSHAETFQWRDSSGRLVISDRPPPLGVREVKKMDTAPAPSGGAAQNANQATIAEQEMAFRKRQQEAREKADKDAKEAATAAQKRENCARARSHLQALESGRRIILPDGKGGETFLEDADRGAEIANAQKTISESCN